MTIDSEQQARVRLEVREIETVTGDFLTDPGRPFWRIEINGFCADFDYPEVAENFRDAIEAFADEARLAERKEASRVRELLVAFFGELTNGDRNRENCLSINHDALVTLVARTRRELAQIATAIRTPNEGEVS